MAENKKVLRAKYKALRQELNSTQMDDLSLMIANNVLKLDIWNNTYFHLFLSIEDQEVNTEFILHLLQGKDKEVVVSKSDFSTLTMNHYLLTDNTRIKKNEYNIPEPIDGIEVPVHKIEVVFVPLLAFDTKGNRVGYGKGFYDKFLSQCKTNVIKIGLSFFEPESVIEGVYESDVRLDYCVTPKRMYSFNSITSI
jgi:5-formyltetrahydrofolate cyclo-ligase